MRQYRGILLILTIGFQLCACTKDNPDIPNPNYASYTTDLEQFKVVWQGLSTNYVLWQDDPTNWDSVYQVGLQVFSGPDDNLSDSVWEETWKELTHSLIDHHMEISLQRPSTHHFIHYSPGDDEVKSRPDCSIRLLPLYRVQMINHLVQDHRITDTAKCNKAYCGMLDNDIAYLYISDFDFSEQNSIMLSHYTRVLSHYKSLLKRESTKATILDLRDNNGGNRIEELMSCYLTNQMIIGYNQTKIGLNRYDLGPQIPHIVVPNSDAINYENPIVVLTTSFSASMSEIATSAIRQLANGYSYGLRTYGATCTLSRHADSMGFDSFGKGYGHYIKIANHRFTNSEGVSIEGYGIAPNVECHFDSNDYNDFLNFPRKDNQLEGAILFAREKCK